MYKEFFPLLLLIIFPYPNVYGHGFGSDTISSIGVEDREISITVTTPMYLDNSKNNTITIKATDEESKKAIKNLTLLIGMYHKNEMIFRNYFFSPNGEINLNFIQSEQKNLEIIGKKNDFLNSYIASESNPTKIKGPVFETGGLYDFEIKIRTIGDEKNVIEGPSYSANVSIADTVSFTETSSKDQNVEFEVKSYFDNIRNFEYLPDKNTIEFEMPFEWNAKQISHIPVVHVEVHIPKDFEEFLTPSYIGKVNDVKLFKSSLTVDDYSIEDERIIHFVILQDHLKYIQNQLEETNIHQNKMKFTVTTSDEIDFPIIAMTEDEEYRVDLSWEPLEIQPGESTKFIFTIRDGETGELLRNSSYDFVLIQNGEDIYRKSSNVQIGGGFEKYKFSEDQTGPTIVRFENIRGTDYQTEFGIVVTPEFGSAIAIMLITSILLIYFSRTKLLKLR
ncbi:MAG: peptidase [Nitrosopumilaceae archaeon]|nr:peptidase [Nitrosopumilaceae archaeon]NIT99897.1 peptidase [Nitrosopumilaceae archaeon]NIU86251.1 peptidase [Nitrosopumilaceae archaeon]NIV65006.1 peptidase [Nitrosopumilaceae archaeon]NIX60500.1 peptidase [Nitrosopumilaceae archaeon]